MPNKTDEATHSLEECMQQTSADLTDKFYKDTVQVILGYRDHLVTDHNVNAKSALDGATAVVCSALFTTLESVIAETIAGNYAANTVQSLCGRANQLISNAVEFAQELNPKVKVEVVNWSNLNEETKH